MSPPDEPGASGYADPAFGLFLKRFLQSPSTVGAIAPSSRFLARRMIEPIRWSSGMRVVEYGPGTGPFTAEILGRLPPDGHYLGIEQDRVFYSLLRERFPSAQFHHGSVEDLAEILEERQWPCVDHIVSGLPFASFPRDLVGRVLEVTARSLCAGGTFTTFQYIHAYAMRSARTVRRIMRRDFQLRQKRRVVFRNLPPAFVLTWSKS